MICPTHGCGQQRAPDSRWCDDCTAEINGEPVEENGLLLMLTFILMIVAIPILAAVLH